MIDAPVNGAMLKLGDAAPIDAKLSQEDRRIIGSFDVLDETPVSILLTEGTGQIVAALPDAPLVIHCIKDAPPAIEMKWPTQDVSAAPDAEVKIAAVLRDDVGVACGEGDGFDAGDAAFNRSPPHPSPLPKGEGARGRRQFQGRP